MAALFQKARQFFADSNSQVPMTLDADHEQVEQSIRQSFVRKVYGILISQLVFSLLLIFLFTIFDGPRYFIITNPFVSTLMSFVVFIILLVFFFSVKCRRTRNRNYIILFVLTLAKAYNLGAMAAYFSLLEVLLCLLISSVMCVGLTVYAIKTARDFTKHTKLTLILFCVLIFMLFFGPSANSIVVFRIIFALINLVVFAVWFVYHTQLIIGGPNRKYSFSPEEYIFSDVLLFLEIASILYACFSLFGAFGSVFAILLSSFTMRERGASSKSSTAAQDSEEAQTQVGYSQPAGY